MFRGDDPEARRQLRLSQFINLRSRLGSSLSFSHGHRAKKTISLATREAYNETNQKRKSNPRPKNQTIKKPKSFKRQSRRLPSSRPFPSHPSPAPSSSQPTSKQPSQPSTSSPAGPLRSGSEAEEPASRRVETIWLLRRRKRWFRGFERRP